MVVSKMNIIKAIFICLLCMLIGMLLGEYVVRGILYSYSYLGMEGQFGIPFFLAIEYLFRPLLAGGVTAFLIYLLQKRVPVIFSGFCKPTIISIIVIMSVLSGFSSIIYANYERLLNRFIP